jgi:phosphoribosyl 1,2-cyclic phosphodiesterase
MSKGISFSLISLLLRTNQQETKKESKLIFMGTGTSSGIPLVSCLTKPEKTCKTCLDAIKPNSKNSRRNTSILLQKKVDGEFKNVLIDCGKFFFHGALNLLPKFNVQRIDAVLLTHEHLGLNF